eukprot:TRINITY_DN5397_c1_g1_i1.p1 TRINITY_DN5397_c1_g1~~TRINITY_DN5397_c1_g1_i1.p1  ORF type:complete len:272 (+),score=58.82 TRINITY_DN5397_c1_g1_i1:48-818(+)
MAPATDTMEHRRRNAAKLKEGYSQTKRVFEYCCLVSFAGLWVWNAVRIAGQEFDLLGWVVGYVTAMIVADFMSGLVHWGADTWGSTETPVLGTFIRSFREHHVDAYAMCKHDFVETNGDNNMLCIPLLCWMALLPIKPEGALYTIGSYNWHVYSLILTLLISFTNQFHKMSHQIKPHPFAKLLMSTNLVLTRENHAVHHKGLHDQSYCITNGWLNPVLDRINFWRQTEDVITKLTGYIPREDDVALLGVEEVPKKL